MTFDRDIYLQRIGLAAADSADGLSVPSIDTLLRLLAAQMRAIPFENIDVFLGAVPDLDAGALWAKLVDARRGGYCLELNGLFGRALEAFGFAAVPILGRVRMGAASGGPRVHHAFIVTIDGEEWLVDAGFGGPGPVGPVRLSADLPQVIEGERFRILQDAETGEDVLQRQNAKDWFSLYGFDRTPVAPVDFAAANVVCARWQNSPFPAHLMMTVPSFKGRVSLFDRSVKHGRGGADSVELSSEAELEDLFAEHFGMSLTRPLVDAIWRKLAAMQAPKG